MIRLEGDLKIFSGDLEGLRGVEDNKLATIKFLLPSGTLNLNIPQGDDHPGGDVGVCFLRGGFVFQDPEVGIINAWGERDGEIGCW